MYTNEDKSTGIAHRCINDNLPKFLDNVKVFEKILGELNEDDFQKIDCLCTELTGMHIEKLFCVDNFSYVLTSGGIESYNDVIGSYTRENGTKEKGINEIINLSNQELPRNKRLPKMKMLYKQILADRESISFIPETFSSDDELLNAVKEYYTEFICRMLDKLEGLFSDLSAFDLSGIYLKNGSAVCDLSNKVLGYWYVIKEQWNEEYSAVKKIKDYDTFAEERSKKWKSIDSFSLAQLQKYVDNASEKKYNSISDYYRDIVSDLVKEIKSSYSLAESLLTAPYDADRHLSKNDDDIKLIKNLLDSVKKLEYTLKSLMGSGKEDDRDLVFYGALEENYTQLRNFDKLYDKVRNYVTKKPYSKDKIKLNFDNPQFMGGWDKSKEPDYRTVLLRNNGMYYLGIIDKSCSKLFENYPSDNSNGWEKINYGLLPGPNKMLPKVFFAKSNIDYYAPSQEIINIYKGETFKKGDKFSLDDCHKLIDFYKEAISRTSNWEKFNFSFKDTDQYNDISEFYRDVEKQGYKIDYSHVSESFINESIDSGKLYLFQIYSKDFSEYSKGTPNLHTLYFKMLFDERNLKDPVYQLNGGAEMFYRFPSIKPEERVIHPKNNPIKNKNPDKIKNESVFEYDLIKDKRFTQPQFSVHIPIKVNFKAIGCERINSDVRLALKNCADNYVIGIDRGERNLLYITVIDGNGKIVEQFSGNTIISGANGKEHTVDYHKLLNNKEDARLKARQNWETIENIKELKEGYISQIVHKICELVVKYDAVIAMEDLNSGFKNSRVKVEKQVYQKFEKMLIDKLNYLVNKNISADENGGLLKAYQLTEKFESFKKMGRQNGFIFYVPAWLTSKIDPVTGFVDLLKPKYSSVEASREFFGKFDSIRYNAAENYFEFAFDYKNFPKGSTDYKGKWTVCTYGNRIKTERSNEEANGNYISKEVNLTDEFTALFNKFGVDYLSNNLKELILRQDKKEFFEKLTKLLSLTLQMRNSITGTDEDHLISPVRGSDGTFYCSRNYDDSSPLPANADANGAYNIARKALWAINVLKNTEDDQIMNAKISISNKEWLEFVQR